MKTLRHIVHGLAILALAAGAFTPAMAAVLPIVSPEVPQSIILASGDCYAAGQRYAAQVGGQLARATPEARGGRTICVVVVLMPARDGQHPRRDQVELPLN